MARKICVLNKLDGRFLKTIIPVVIIQFVLCACSESWWVGEGRGDWYLDLCDGYKIDKVNSRQILLVHQEDPDDISNSIVIDNYYITAYQVYDPYVCVEGIPTKESTISDEELAEGRLQYYIINTVNDETVGPFDSEQSFVDYCISQALVGTGEWVKVSG